MRATDEASLQFVNPSSVISAGLLTHALPPKGIVSVNNCCALVFVLKNKKDIKQAVVINNFMERIC